MANNFYQYEVFIKIAIMHIISLYKSIFTDIFILFTDTGILFWKRSMWAAWTET